jgi:hypothetical protein
MSVPNLPAPFAEIDAMIERGELAAARDSLAALPRAASPSALTELVELKLALRDGSLRPQVAMNRLLALMRADKELPGAHDLYREASTAAYEAGRSSLSHSHPPPPMKK